MPAALPRCLVWRLRLVWAMPRSLVRRRRERGSRRAGAARGSRRARGGIWRTVGDFAFQWTRMGSRSVVAERVLDDVACGIEAGHRQVRRKAVKRGTRRQADELGAGEGRVICDCLHDLARAPARTDARRSWKPARPRRAARRRWRAAPAALARRLRARARRCGARRSTVAGRLQLQVECDERLARGDERGAGARVRRARTEVGSGGMARGALRGHTLGERGDATTAQLRSRPAKAVAGELAVQIHGHVELLGDALARRRAPPRTRRPARRCRGRRSARRRSAPTCGCAPACAVSPALRAKTSIAPTATRARRSSASARAH